MMELPDAVEDVNDHWRPVSRLKGLNLPMLLKVSSASTKITSFTMS